MHYRICFVCMKCASVLEDTTCSSYSDVKVQQSVFTENISQTLTEHPLTGDAVPCGWNCALAAVKSKFVVPEPVGCPAVFICYV